MAILYGQLWWNRYIAGHENSQLKIRDFQISFSNRDTSRNAWNRHLGSFMVDTGILSNSMKFPSHEC